MSGIRNHFRQSAFNAEIEIVRLKQFDMRLFRKLADLEHRRVFFFKQIANPTNLEICTVNQRFKFSNVDDPLGHIPFFRHTFTPFRAIPATFHRQALQDLI